MMGRRWTIVPPAEATRASMSAPGRNRATTPMRRDGSSAATLATSGEAVCAVAGMPDVGGWIWPGCQLTAVIARAALAAATVIQRQLAAAADGRWRAA